MSDGVLIEQPSFLIENDYQAINDLFEQEGWTDGLPIMPPVEVAVEAMLEAAGRHRSDVLGKLAPAWAEATVEKIAVNAVMAGCRPQYMPVIIAAVEAVADEAFDLHGIQATTHGAAPLVVVNGPIRRELNINCRYNCFGPGYRANATIGRAMRLILQNIGGGTPGVMDRATTGMPSKYTYCVGENEEESPWEPLHVEKGYAREDNAVTVFPADGPHDVLDRSSGTAKGILTSLAHALSPLGSCSTIHFSDSLLAICPEHAAIVAQGGYSKAMVREFIFKNGGLPLSFYGPELGLQRKRDFEEMGITLGEDDRVPIAEKPEDIEIIVLGGAGKHSTFIGTLTRAHRVTRAIHLPSSRA